MPNKKGQVVQQDYLVPYLSEKDESSRSWDRVDDKELEFYIAGYTHYQGAHETLYKHVAKHSNESPVDEKIFPVARELYSIDFHREPENKHDTNAIRIELTIAGIDQKLVLGYVPRKFNAAVIKGWDRLSDVGIYKVKSKHIEKYYSTKIVIGYDGHNFRRSNNHLQVDRFANIEE